LKFLNPHHQIKGSSTCAMQHNLHSSYHFSTCVTNSHRQNNQAKER